jgi:hypothetical protein
LGVTALGGLSPVALNRLDDAFPRSRFLALDIETTGLSAAHDRLRTLQLADGENAALVVFDRPLAAHSLVVLADFLRGGASSSITAASRRNGCARPASTLFSTTPLFCSPRCAERACRAA